MPILRQQDQQAVREKFDVELKQDVKLTLFTQRNIGGLFIPGRECKSCGPTQELLEEISALSPRVKLDTIDFYSDPEEARARGIEKIPAVVLGPNWGENVRFYGLPSGHEFPVLLDSLVGVSSKRSTLQLETRRQLRRLKDEIHIQVFVTPT